MLRDLSEGVTWPIPSLFDQINAVLTSSKMTYAVAFVGGAADT